MYISFFRTMKLPTVDIRDYDNYDNYDDTLDQPIQTHFVIQLRLHLPTKIRARLGNTHSQKEIKKRNNDNVICILHVVSTFWN